MLDERAARASSPLILARPRLGAVRRSLRETAAAAPAAVWVGAIVVTSAVVRFVLAGGSVAPWIIPDELIYSELAKSLARSGRFLVRGEAFSVWSFGPVYPLLVAPAYRFAGTVAQAYVIVKAVNCMFFSSAAIPAYLLASRLVRRSSAVAAAAFAVAVPSGIYTTKIMTESVSYPLFLWAFLAMVSMLERPTARRQLYALGSIVLATLCRAQMVALLPALLCSIALVAGYEGWLVAGRISGRELVRQLRVFRTTWLTLGFALTAAFAGAVVKGITFADLLGGHTVLFERIRPLDAPRWFVYHAAELALYIGVIPVAAAILLAPALVRRDGPRSERVFALTAAATAGALLALVAVYASQPNMAPHVYDRYTFYIAPLLLVAFFAWLEHGAPRPRRRARVATAVACVLPLAVPYGELLNGREWGVSSSTVALVPWVGIHGLTGTSLSVFVLVALFSAAFGRLFLRANGKRAAAVLATAVAMNFFAISFAAYARNGQVAEIARGLGVGASPGWVDAAVGPDADVIEIWSGRMRGLRGPYALWETDLFNASVGRLYHLRAPLPDDSPSAKVVVRRSQLVSPGRGPLVAGYVVTDASVPVDADLVAADRLTGLMLYHVQGPVRLRAHSASASGASSG